MHMNAHAYFECEYFVKLTEREGTLLAVAFIDYETSKR